jgi:16S rRNA (guanine527-N7)-methyltransferase
MDARVLRGIDALVERYGMPHGSAAQFVPLLELVVSDPLAPTTVRDPGKVLDDHLADSLVALELEPVRHASVVSDLGSGAGFPGLPLAIALPAAQVSLLESNGRKCAFLERAAAACEVANVRVLNTRAESWAEGIGTSDLVTVRAVAALDVVAEYAAPLLTLGGALVAWRGQRDIEAEDAGKRAASQLGLEVAEPVPVQPYRGAEHRHLHVMSKVMPTPAGFPRRPGMALKRPLGHSQGDVAPPSDR